MADEDDLISQILNEDYWVKKDLNRDLYDINSLLNPKEENKVEVSEDKKDIKEKEEKKDDIINKENKKLDEKEELKIKPKQEEKIENNLDNNSDDVDDIDKEINNILNEEINDNIFESQINKESKLLNLNNEKDDFEKDIEKIIEEGKKQKIKDEKEMLKRKQDQEKKKIKISYPHFKNPIDLIHYLEVEKIILQNNIENKNFTLEKHRKESNQYDVSQINVLTFINKNLSKYNINLIFTKLNILIVVTEINFLFFSLETQKLIKTIFPKNLKSNKVTCLDITDDFNEILVGYQKGIIALINIESGEIKYINNKLHENSSLLELKIYKKENNDLSFISSNNKGDIYFNTLKLQNPLSLSWEINSVKINIDNSYPIFLIKFFQFSKENQKLNLNLKELKKYVILGSLEAIWIYCVSPLQEIFKINKPSFIKEIVIPDAQVGIGNLPDVFTRFIKKDEKNNLLLIISWGKIIYFSQLNLNKENSIEKYKELGYYNNLFNIIRIGFMNNSVVYCIDKSYSIKFLDTSKIITEKMKIINNYVAKPKSSYLTEVAESKLISAYISSKKNIFGNNKNLLDTYLYSIVESEDKNTSLIILGENKIYFVSLVDWLFFLENLQNKKDFINLFSIGIEIYKRKMMSFSNLPEENLKKQIIGDKLKEIISQYIINNIQEIKTNQEKINSSIKIAIEILIEIDSFDYLLKSILPILESNYLGELFLTTLEPFILCDKIKKIYLPNEIILNLIDFYTKKNQLDLLSQILLHININNLDNSEIRQKLEELNLFTPLIYLLIEGKNENLIILKKCLNFFIQKKNIIMS